jgi:hypothetical protein
MQQKGATTMFPKARKDQIKSRELADETMIYDKSRGKAHCLNATAAFIWRHCDGYTSIAELAGSVQKELGIPEAEPVVRLALEQLSSRNLLEETVVPLSGNARFSRRDALKKLAVAAVAIPLIMTVTAKTARASSSVVACLITCNYVAGTFTNSKITQPCPSGKNCVFLCPNTSSNPSENVAGGCA